MIVSLLETNSGEGKGVRVGSVALDVAIEALAERVDHFLSESVSSIFADD